MKKYLLILLIIIELTIIKVPTYTELNNLAIIEKISIEEKNNQYTLIMKEIIPIKADQGIEYEYEFYEATATSFEKAYKKIQKSTKKKLYLKRTKSLITNITSTQKIIESLNIKPKNIIHTNNISKEIKN